MIIVSTPLRISFLGGGSDYPEYFLSGNSGFTFGTSINLFVHLSGIFHGRLSDYPYKLTYRITDNVYDYRNFKHPVAPHAFELVGWKNQGVHISTMADVPAGTGLGSSSSFTVGLLHLLSTMKQTEISPRELAQKSIQIERKILEEPGGYQDQYFAAYGGPRLLAFSSEGVQVSDALSMTSIQQLSEYLVLVPAGVSRDSAIYARITSNSAKIRFDLVGELAGIAKETFDYFVAHHGSESAIEKLARNMLISWEIKKIISEQKENSLVDNLINHGLDSGAIGAKLCGAGGSGFVLFLVPPDQRNAFVKKFEHLGAQEIASVPYGSKVRIIE